MTKANLIEFTGDTTIKGSDITENTHIHISGGKLTIEGDINTDLFSVIQTGDRSKPGIILLGNIGQHTGDLGSTRLGERYAKQLIADGSIRIAGSVSNGSYLESLQNVDVAGSVRGTSTELRGGQIFADELYDCKVYGDDILANRVIGARISANTLDKGKVEVNHSIISSTIKAHSISQRDNSGLVSASRLDAESMKLGSVDTRSALLSGEATVFRVDGSVTFVPDSHDSATAKPLASLTVRDPKHSQITLMPGIPGQVTEEGHVRFDSLKAEPVTRRVSDLAAPQQETGFAGRIREGRGERSDGQARG